MFWNPQMPYFGQRSISWQLHCLSDNIRPESPQYWFLNISLNMLDRVAASQLVCSVSHNLFVVVCWCKSQSVKRNIKTNFVYIKPYCVKSVRIRSVSGLFFASSHTAWKVSVFGVFLVCSLHQAILREKCPYSECFWSDCGKIRTLFT